MKYQTKTLGTVAEYINGRAFKPSEWENNGLPIIRIQNLTNPNAPFNYSSSEHEKKFLIKNGDLLFAWSASLGAHIWNGSDAWLNQHIFKVVPKNDVDKKFLYYYLSKVVSDLYSKAHGTGMVHITKKPFMNTPIPILDIMSQRIIVKHIEESLSQLDSAVATLNKTKQQLKIYRQAVLKEAFDTATSDCRMMSIGDLLTTERKGMTTGPFGTLIKKSDHLTSGVPMLGIENIGRGQFVAGNRIFVSDEKAKELSSFQVFEGDLIISRSGTVGEICPIPKQAKGSLLSTNLIRITLNNRIILNNYFIALFQSKGIVLDQIKELCKGSTRLFLNQSILKRISFPVPTLFKQKRIVDVLSARTEAIKPIETTIDQSLQQSEALRQSILKQAFSMQGEI